MAIICASARENKKPGGCRLLLCQLRGAKVELPPRRGYQKNHHSYQTAVSFYHKKRILAADIPARLKPLPALLAGDLRRQAFNFAAGARKPHKTTGKRHA